MTQKVSCWTTDDLARVVEAAEARHITAEQVQKIVLGTFTPDDVADKVEALLSEPGWSHKELSNAMLDTLERMEGVLAKSPRTVDMLAVQIAMLPDFTGIEKDDIASAADQMAKASKGMLHVTPEGTLHLPGAMDELRRRLDGVTGTAGAPRRRGTFRKPSDSDAE
jgi:hypothetical protein